MLKFLITLSFAFNITHAYEQAFPKTPVGEIEVKTLPASKLIACHGQGDYFDRSDSLFRPLFRYIQENDIAMTTPVEAEILPSVMYFYIGADAANRPLTKTDTIDVVELPARTVLSLGIRGGYSSENFAKGEALLRAWLSVQEGYRAAGPARAIYWNGPFTPWPLKRSEIHLPIERSELPLS